jgi:hypothetical protein
MDGHSWWTNTIIGLHGEKDQLLASNDYIIVGRHYVNIWI